MPLKVRLIVVAMVLAVAVTVLVAHQPVVKAASSNGWTTTVSLSRTQVSPRDSVTMTVTVASTTPMNALVDLEIYSGSTKVFQQVWDGQSFLANSSLQYSATWIVPAGEAASVHVVKVGVFGAGWFGLAHWNDDAARFAVTFSGASTTLSPTTAAKSPARSRRTTTTLPPTTTAKPITTTAPATTLPPTTTTGAPQAHFATLPPGSALPSDATCAAQVRPMAERRPGNATANHTRGSAVTGLARVTGDFTGTTDEIIEWVACKWGIDEDVVRAQIAKESWWHQDATGDFTTDQSVCDPLYRTGSGQCPESIGLGQVRYQYHTIAFTNEYAVRSSAFNLDYTYSVWRACYEGQYTWLNTVERGATYGAGDLWGCVGTWFAGRWHTAPAETYIAAVKDYLNQRVWETPNFQGG